MHISKSIYLLLILIVWSCNSTDNIIDGSTLEAYLFNRNTDIGGVIACSSSGMDDAVVFTYYYPESGASDIRFYETSLLEDDPWDFSNYMKVSLQSTPFFNGYLGKFESSPVNEKWIVITCELHGDIKVSNPIRIKQNTKPSVWTDTIEIDQQQMGMPEFTWTDDAFGDNAIYFQVLADAQGDLLSGTYTYDNHFQYYNTANVVLNITQENPPDLIQGQTYSFTIMDVSADNWVNAVFTKTFIVQ